MRTRQGCIYHLFIELYTGDNQVRKASKRYSDWQERVKIISSCRWHVPIYRKSYETHIKLELIINFIFSPPFLATTNLFSVVIGLVSLYACLSIYIWLHKYEKSYNIFPLLSCYFTYHNAIVVHLYCGKWQSFILSNG